MKTYVSHELDAYYNKDSKVLILGSMPSIKSKQLGFYYMHPQNRFWKTLGMVYGDNVPVTIDDRKTFLNKHKIALWDVIESCTIDGSSDSSIKDVKVNDINNVLKKTNISKIFVTGKKAYDLYNKYCLPNTNKEAIYLPSTSPANCPKGIEDKLMKYYSVIKEITEEDKMYTEYYSSNIGMIKIVAANEAVTDIIFVNKQESDNNPNPVTKKCKKELQEYFEGKRTMFSVPINMNGTTFQTRVWKELLSIPYGEITTYEQMAINIGNKKAVRAVASTIGKNPISIICPCHRVIGKNGKLTGYAWGLDIKEKLLDIEKRTS